MPKQRDSVNIPQYLSAVLSYQASIQTRRKYNIKHNEILMFMFYAGLGYLGYELTKRRLRTVFRSFGNGYISFHTDRLLEHGLLVSHPGIHPRTSIPYNYFTISDFGLTVLSEIEEGFYLFYRKVVERR